MTDLDLSALSTGPAPVLASGADIRARGEQRRHRSRIAVAGATALVVALGAGTAVALADRGEPDALVPTTPSPSASPSAALVPEGPEITWAAFTPVSRMHELVGGEWLSLSVQDYDFPDEYDRCDVDKLLTTQRTGLVTRELLVGNRTRSVVLTVEDYASAADAKAALGQRVDAIRRCPSMPIDAPGAGSTETSTVRDAEAGESFTVRVVTHECQQDNADCADHASVRKTVATGHLLLTVSTHRSDGEFSINELDRISADFAARALPSYDTPATHPSPGPVAQGAELGGRYYAAFLWTHNDGQDNGMAQAQAEAADYDPVLTTRLACLDGGAAAVGRDHPGASHGDVVALLFDSNTQLEQFVNAHDRGVEGVGIVTVACLDAPHGAGRTTTPAPAPPSGDHSLSAGDKLQVDRIGPVVVGMTLAEAREAAAVELRQDGDDLGGCVYFAPRRKEPDVSFMVIRDVVSRIDVYAGSTTTIDGIGIGATEAQVKAAYPSTVVSKHYYTDGHYLRVLSEDGRHAFLFETDGTKVLRFRSGFPSAVDQVEGCA